MEIKKSKTADLEGRRTQRLLLGLVVALACLFVGLEYSIEPDDPLDDPELLAMLDSEMELPPLLQQEDEQMLAPKAEPEPTTKLVVVDEAETTDEPQQDEEPVETDMDDDMNASDELIDEIEPPAPADRQAGRHCGTHIQAAAPIRNWKRQRAIPAMPCPRRLRWKALQRQNGAHGAMSLSR